MMNADGRYAWSNPWFRWSVGSLVVLTLLSMLVGFVWLPSVHADFSAQGVWASICRAAGVPSAWSAGKPPPNASAPATNVVLEPAMARAGAEDSIGRGATLALNCTMCHGAQGMSVSNAPNLSGQFPEVIIKQMHDYKIGKRSSSIMQALAINLTDREIRDLGAYYASLPKARSAPTTYDDSLPALVRVGDPLRNIAPCISCHGGVDRKLGTPWLEGMPRDYLAEQLRAFKTGERRNDAHAQMRNMAREMTAKEIEELSVFYARKGVGGQQH